MGHLKFVVKKLPQKNDFQGNLTFPNDSNHPTCNPPIRQKSIQGFRRELALLLQGPYHTISRMPFQVNLIQVLQQFLPQLKLSQEEGFSKFYLPLAFFPTVNYCTVSVFDHPVQLLIVYLSVSQFEHVATYLVHLSLFLFLL